MNLKGIFVNGTMKPAGSRGEARADALGSVLQVRVGRFWGLVKWDTFLVSDFKWETGGVWTPPLGKVKNSGGVRAKKARCSLAMESTKKLAKILTGLFFQAKRHKT